MITDYFHGIVLLLDNSRWAVQFYYIAFSGTNRLLQLSQSQWFAEACSTDIIHRIYERIDTTAPVMWFNIAAAWEIVIDRCLLIWEYKIAIVMMNNR